MSHDTSFAVIQSDLTSKPSQRSFLNFDLHFSALFQVLAQMERFYTIFAMQQQGVWRFCCRWFPWWNLGFPILCISIPAPKRNSQVLIKFSSSTFVVWKLDRWLELSGGKILVRVYFTSDSDQDTNQDYVGFGKPSRTTEGKYHNTLRSTENLQNQKNALERICLLS